MQTQDHKIRGLVLITVTALLATAAAQQEFTGKNLRLNLVGTAKIGGVGATAGPGGGLDDFVAQDKGELSLKRILANGVAAPLGSFSASAALQSPRPNGHPVVNAGKDLTGFQGLNHRQQRLAGTGAYVNSQFSSEPPDVPLAVGNGFVMAAVNTAIALYDTTGNLLAGPTPLNQFFGLKPEVVRGSSPIFGDYTSDPRCLYDSDTGRWFVTILQEDTDPVTGNFLNPSSVLIAVSQTSDPRGAYFIYALDTTGFLPDQPLIGVNGNAMIITFNLFTSLSSPPAFFVGGFVVALQKSALVAGGSPNGVIFGPLPLAEGLAYSLQPAAMTPGADDEEESGQTEYFLSALDFDGTLDNRIAVWAMTGTSTLNNVSPNVKLASTILRTQVYGQPPPADQKAGPTPLGSLVGEPLLQLASNDDRMNQVVYANGVLYGALNTVVSDGKGPDRVGIAYFVIAPEWEDKKLHAEVEGQGYVAAAGNNVLFPAVAVNREGKGVIAFTLDGHDFYPSAAYVNLNDFHAMGPIRLAAAGAGPDDGFSGYVAFGGNGVGRWGDYSTATVDADGSIWFATEYIPGGPRTLLANWGTFLGRVGE
jgi:hypothetical protein